MWFLQMMAIMCNNMNVGLRNLVGETAINTGSLKVAAAVHNEHVD